MKRRLFALVPVLTLVAACATSPVATPVSRADAARALSAAQPDRPHPPTTKGHK